MHRLVHIVPFLSWIHNDHHKFVNQHDMGWHWSNLFLFNDTLLSTIDLWITEVIPTIIFTYFFGAWVFLSYYFWAAFIQERVEHNQSFNLYPVITSGRWHMIHHRNAKANYGIFLPVWDKLFGTWQPIKTG